MPLPVAVVAANNAAAVMAASVPINQDGVGVVEAGENIGQKMICTVCQWVYDPAEGEPNQYVAPGTAWEAVPDDFLCPGCALGKSVFDPYEG